MLVDLNLRLCDSVRYIVRMEPGVQTPEETLEKGSGSCRDSGWLLVQLLRHLGLAARFVSGYLIQLRPDIKALDGPAGPEEDFTDLHAWAEVYLPGAGWVGLDPTSGLLAGEGHIPLAATALPSSAAPVTGLIDPCESSFEVTMRVTRIHEDPRVTRPLTEAQWQAVDALGHRVEAQLQAAGVRLTMGGEPTFVSVDDMDGVEWNFNALGERKRELAGELLLRLRDRFAPGSVLYHGQGKWYPGEPLPRWALGVLWRDDGVALWRDPKWLAADDVPSDGAAEASLLARTLAALLGLDGDCLIPAYEDVWNTVRAEASLPVNVDPLQSDLTDPAARSRLAVQLAGELGQVRGYVLPLRPAPVEGHKPGAAHAGWQSCRWPLRREHLYLLSGDSPMGYRLPLDSLPWQAPEDEEPVVHPDPFAERHPLPAKLASPGAGAGVVADGAVFRTALCIEAREGRVNVFLPPLPTVEDFVELLASLEEACERCGVRVRIEGYLPGADTRLQRLFVTPDPGVIEVNVHPARTWDELTGNTRVLYEEARLTRLSTEKFMLDGKHSGTGGGNHVTIGGPTPAESPLLRRPDLLRSLIAYWQNHPALSYLFSGTFIGPTSQAPRIDEARNDSVYEIEIALRELDRLQAGAMPGSLPPWTIDRLLRNLLTDVTGNTHRAEFCIDKLYAPGGPSGRLGLLEMRAFEMPPHARMSLAQQLLMRALVARFWKSPYQGRLIDWGTSLHDRFLLPHFVAEDMQEVIEDLGRAGYAFDAAWFAPFFEFRFPRFGTVNHQGIEVEIRQALEPWHVLGEEGGAGGTVRYVDSSVERLQVLVSGLVDDRHVLACNGREVPLQPTGRVGEFVAGVRYRAWQPPSCLHPTIGAHAPLVFDLADTWMQRSMGGAQYHVAHPGGRNYATFPVNAYEAEARRLARFFRLGHTPGRLAIEPAARSPELPFTLDLRRTA
jgi:uncharacterized protein (DUF2126 family)